VKVHRAVTLVVMMALGLALVAAMTAYGVATFSGGSLVALAVVVVGAAIAGVAFSYRRYFPRRR
jgi:K+-transporting ATPase c subunit